MLESKPPRNNQPETHLDDEMGAVPNGAASNSIG